MAPETIEILSSALALPVRDRARIAHELLVSLDAGQDADASEAWVTELERRSKELASGAVRAESWNDVRAALAARWRRK